MAAAVWPQFSLRFTSIMAAATADSLTDPAEAVVQTVLETLTKAIGGDSEALGQLVGGYLLPAVGALLAVMIGYMVASYLARVASGPVCRRVDQTLGKFLGRVIFYSVLLGVIAGVLSQIGVKLGGLATILAAAGFAIGLAFQGTLSNFAAGVMLLVFRPFKVGDMIVASGLTGKVNEIDLFTTTLDTPDHRRIILPNSSIFGSTIENISYHQVRRVEVAVSVAFQADLELTRETLHQAALDLGERMIQGEGRGHMVLLVDLTGNTLNWVVRAWVASTDFFPARDTLTAAVKARLQQAAIPIAYPHMNLHVHPTDGWPGAAPLPAVPQAPTPPAVPQLVDPQAPAGSAEPVADMPIAAGPTADEPLVRGRQRPRMRDGDPE